MRHAPSRFVVSLAILASSAGLAACGSSSTSANTSTAPAATAATSDNTAATAGSASSSSASSSPAPSSSAVGAKAGKYTMADVKKHNSAASCWAAVNGNVYDLTKWINKHPGGKAAIKALCGTDATKAFSRQHGRDSRPKSVIKSYKIGTLS